MLFILGIDQGTKALVIHLKQTKKKVHRSNGILQIKLVKNTGAAFSILRNRNRLILWMNIPIIIILMIGLYLLMGEKGLLLFKIAVICILGGALGNITDRIRRGYVVDFIYFPFNKWPVFNMADFFILIGSIIIMILAIFQEI